MAAPKGISEKRFIEALKKSDGIYFVAAKKLGISRQAVFARVANSPRLQAVVREIGEECLDVVESRALKAAKSGDDAYVRWLLERKGKKRGYGTKLETSVDDAQLEAFVASLGGDATKFRAALAALGAAFGEGP